MDALWKRNLPSTEVGQCQTSMSCGGVKAGRQTAKNKSADLVVKGSAKRLRQRLLYCADDASDTKAAWRQQGSPRLAP